MNQDALIDMLAKSQLPWLVRKNKSGEVLAAFDLLVAALSYIEKCDCGSYASVYDSVKNKWWK